MKLEEIAQELHQDDAETRKQRIEDFGDNFDISILNIRNERYHLNLQKIKQIEKEPGIYYQNLYATFIIYGNDLNLINEGIYETAKKLKELNYPDVCFEVVSLSFIIDWVYVGQGMGIIGDFLYQKLINDHPTVNDVLQNPNIYGDHLGYVDIDIPNSVLQYGKHYIKKGQNIIKLLRKGTVKDVIMGGKSYDVDYVLHPPSDNPNFEFRIESQIWHGGYRDNNTIKAVIRNVRLEVNGGGYNDVKSFLESQVETMSHGKVFIGITHYYKS